VKLIANKICRRRFKVQKKIKRWVLKKVIANFIKKIKKITK